MPYRNGSYIAFHADGTAEPTESDMKYFNLLKAWNANPAHPLEFINSHEKTSSVRDSSKRETLRRSLVTRLQNSKNMLLIVGKTTRFDTDWVPFEIAYAIDECAIPVIAAYPGYDWIRDANAVKELWPSALASRINSGSARVIHVPFRKEPLCDAIPRFSPEEYPVGKGLTVYSDQAYRDWGYFS